MVTPSQQLALAADPQPSD